MTLQLFRTMLLHCIFSLFPAGMMFLRGYSEHRTNADYIYSRAGNRIEYIRQSTGVAPASYGSSGRVWNKVRMRTRGDSRTDDFGC